MTVDAAYIAAISNGLFSVGTGGTISTDTFALYLAQSTTEVEADLPTTINSTLKEEAIAYLICHRIEAWKGMLDVNQENIDGDYSYGKKSGTIDSWLMAYDRLKIAITANKKTRGGYASATHASVSSDMKMDYNQIGS